METPRITRWLKKRRKLMEEVLAREDLIRGSLVKTRKKCGRAGCHCESGEKHRHVYLSVGGPGGNTIVYVPASEEERFRRGTRSYREAWKLLEQISRLNIDIIKGGHRDG